MEGSRYGTRWVCFECQTAFFDMNKENAICPKCKIDQADNPKRKQYKIKAYKKINLQNQSLLDEIDELEAASDGSDMDDFGVYDETDETDDPDD